MNSIFYFNLIGYFLLLISTSLCAENRLDKLQSQIDILILNIKYINENNEKIELKLNKLTETIKNLKSKLEDLNKDSI